MVDFIKRVTSIFKGGPIPHINYDQALNTEIGAGDASYTTFYDNLWRVHYDRRAVYNDLRDMDNNDPIVSPALDVLASCVTGYEDVDIDGFEWEIEIDHPKALQILNDLKTRLDLGVDCWNIVRGFVRNGEEMREVVVDENMFIQRFKSLPSYQVMPQFDAYGNKMPGWVQRPEGKAPGTIIQFEEWQVIAFVYGARRGWFGTGLMFPARRVWKRLQKLEDSMAVARMIRAYDKQIHKVPVKPEWDQIRMQKAVRDYRDHMTRRTGLDQNNNLYMRDNPWDVPTDFFLPDDGTNRGGIELLKSDNQQLTVIVDVEYHQKQLLACTKVPRKFLNLGRGEKGVLTDGSLTAEDIQFARTLRQAQAVLRSGLMKLAWMALIFQGIDARELGLRMRMAKISTTDALQDAKITFTKAQTAEIMVQLLGGLPPELVAVKYMDLDEEEQRILRDFLTAQGDKNAALVLTPNDTEATDGNEDREREIMKVKYAEKTGQSDVNNRPGTEMPVSPQEAAEAIASLQILVQQELEKRGLRFGVGRSERIDYNRSIIEEITTTV